LRPRFWHEPCDRARGVRTRRSRAGV